MRARPAPDAGPAWRENRFRIACARGMGLLIGRIVPEGRDGAEKAAISARRPRPLRRSRAPGGLRHLGRDPFPGSASTIAGSQLVWRLSQNRAPAPKQRPSRTAVSGDTPRSPSRMPAIRPEGARNNGRPRSSRMLQTAPSERMRVMHKDEEAAMTLSVRLDPVPAARVEEEARRLGISTSDLVKDALELRLGLENPYDLLQQARSARPMGNPTASERTGDRLRERLRAKRSH